MRRDDLRVKKLDKCRRLLAKLGDNLGDLAEKTNVLIESKRNDDEEDRGFVENEHTFYLISNAGLSPFPCVRRKTQTCLTVPVSRAPTYRASG